MTVDADRLRVYKRRKNELARLQERITGLQEAAEGLTQALSLAPAHGAEKERLSGQIAEIVDLQARYGERRIWLEKETEAIDELIGNLPEQQAKIVQYRYVDGMPWKKVAKASGYSLHHCYKIHDAAIKNIET